MQHNILRLCGRSIPEIGCNNLFFCSVRGQRSRAAIDNARPPYQLGLNSQLLHVTGGCNVVSACTVSAKLARLLTKYWLGFCCTNNFTSLQTLAASEVRKLAEECTSSTKSCLQCSGSLKARFGHTCSSDEHQVIKYRAVNDMLSHRKCPMH